MKRFICTDNLLMLPISGAFVCLLGLVLLILYIVARGLTASLYYVEGALPTYVAAILLIFTGVGMIVLLKKRPTLLICVAIALNCVAFSLCALQAISVGIVSIPFLGSFSVCVYHSSLSECQCYILSARENNSTGIIVPEADSEKVTFQGVRSCAVIEHNLIDFLHILCIIYGFAGIASLVTSALSFMLLCSQRRATKEAHALREAGFSRHRRTLSINGRDQTNNADTESGRPSNAEPSNTAAASSPGNNTAPNRRATIGHHDVRNERPHMVQRSSSTSAAHGRHQGRHNSVGAGDTRGGTVRGAGGPPHPSQSPRQGRPPALIRGGYLQIHVNGPSIPVYVVSGSSNEAFIALTDLPSLQLPSLDTVPAYVSEITDLYPTDQPPPYSPTADEHHPPAFPAIMESPSTPTSESRRAQPQRLVLHEDDSTNQQSEEQVQSETSNAASVLDSVVAGPSTEPAAANSVSHSPANNTEVSGLDEMAAVQTGSDSQGQTDPPMLAQSSPGEEPQQTSVSEPERSVESARVSNLNVGEPHQDSSLEVRRAPNEVSRRDYESPGTDESPAIQAEPSTATLSQTKSSQPRNSQIDPVGNRPGHLEREERSHITSQNVSRGARPKYQQSRHTGEEAYLAHTRSSSPNRRSSPSRRSASPRRRQAASSAQVGENPTRQLASESPSNREVARARSTSRGRKRQLPDILPGTDRLPDTEIRTSSSSARQPPAESSSNRPKPHHKSHNQQRRRDISPQPPSQRETAAKRPPKNPQNTQSQTVSRSRPKEKPSQSNPKQDPGSKDRKHRRSSAKRKSTSAKVEMDIPPIPTSSSTESLTNIMTLVESVHSSVKAKPKKTRQPSSEDKANLVDSRV